MLEIIIFPNYPSCIQKIILKLSDTIVIVAYIRMDIWSPLAIHEREEKTGETVDEIREQAKCVGEIISSQMHFKPRLNPNVPYINYTRVVLLKQHTNDKCIRHNKLYWRDFVFIVETLY